MTPDTNPTGPVWDVTQYGRLRRPQRMFAAVRHRVPDKTYFLPVMSGIARGVTVPVNPRRELRTLMGLGEIEIARVVRRLVPRGGVAWDVGAAFGYYSLAFARLGARRVLSFEPDSERFELLQSAVRRNRDLSGRVEPFRLALGCAPPMASIDQLVRSDATVTPGFLKIDVDGPEADILMGAVHTLATVAPRLVIETHSFELEVACLETLVKSGYVYRIIDAQTLWPELRPIEVNRWIVATHRHDEAVQVVLRKRMARRA